MSTTLSNNDDVSFNIHATIILVAFELSRFNVPNNTLQVISQAIFPANQKPSLLKPITWLIVNKTKQNYNQQHKNLNNHA